MLSEVLTDVGQKRTRLVAQGGNDELVQQIDKQERKRMKKEEQSSVTNFKAVLKEKITEVNVNYQVSLNTYDYSNLTEMLSRR